MPSLIVTKRSGEVQTISADAGMSVMEAMRAGGIEEVLAICGGFCACATCHVYIDSADWEKVSAPSEDEGELLASAGNVQVTSRLACQVKMSDALDRLRVMIAPES